MVNHPDQDFNLSVARLRKAPEIHSFLKAAQWYVIDTPMAGELVDFLNEIEAKYMLIPYQGSERNYIDGVIKSVETKVSKMKESFDFLRLGLQQIISQRREIHDSLLSIADFLSCISSIRRNPPAKR